MIVGALDGCEEFMNILDALRHDCVGLTIDFRRPSAEQAWRVTVRFTTEPGQPQTFGRCSDER